MAKASVPKQPAKAAATRKPPAKSGAAPVSEPPLTAAVIGGSIAGLMASLVLHHKGFKVVLYEQQPDYKRSIQWTVRQSFIDYVYSVDKDIAAHLFTTLNLVSEVTNGYRFLSDKTLRFPDGAYLYKRRDGLEKGGCVESPGHECTKPDESCAASLEAVFVGIIRAKKLERELLELLHDRKYVKLFRQEAPKCVLRDDGRYALQDGRRKPIDYDLIVVCVGAGKSSREELGFLANGKSRANFPIKLYPLSRPRGQVSGDVQVPRHGMVTAFQHAKIDKEGKLLPYLPSGELLYSTLVSTDEKDTTCWVIGDVSTEFEKKFSKASDTEKDKLATEECAKIATRTLLETDKTVLEVKGAILGYTVKRFVSQAKLSSAAYAGDNLVLAGDAVGAGHWAVGGGMHVAGMCHQKRLEALATDVRDLRAETDRRKRKAAQTASLKRYSDGVLEDTKAWISKSMEYYYLSIPKGVVEAVFTKVMAAFKANKRINVPKEIQKRIVSAYFGDIYDKDLKRHFADEL
jgi:2-polyprenyl-6-methoxyphenol hydroxylase-like FAD-dependent oxidoreductase